MHSLMCVVQTLSIWKSARLLCSLTKAGYLSIHTFRITTMNHVASSALRRSYSTATILKKLFQKLNSHSSYLKNPMSDTVLFQTLSSLPAPPYKATSLKCITVVRIRYAHAQHSRLQISY